MTSAHSRRLTRRQALMAGAGGALATGATPFELVQHGVLPGRNYLNQIDGACVVPAPPAMFGPAGLTVTGSFFSRARGRDVGYTIAYPPGYGRGDHLPLALYMHAFRGSHISGIGGMPLAQTLAGRLRGERMAPIAIAVADGGNLYWHRHPGDDPMAMVVDELLPMCRRLGLGLDGPVPSGRRRLRPRATARQSRGDPADGRMPRHQLLPQPAAPVGAVRRQPAARNRLIPV